jgi:hypothetical protein
MRISAGVDSFRNKEGRKTAQQVHLKNELAAEAFKTGPEKLTSGI